MEIDTVLRNWHDDKKKIDELEKKIQNYKNFITKEFNKKNVDTIKSGIFKGSRKRTTRLHLSKDSVPSHIWNEYAVRCSFDVFHLKKL